MGQPLGFSGEITVRGGSDCGRARSQSERGGVQTRTTLPQVRHTICLIFALGLVAVCAEGTANQMHVKSGGDESRGRGAQGSTSPNTTGNHRQLNIKRVNVASLQWASPREKKQNPPNATDQSRTWVEAGGKYGLSADWREAVSVAPNDGEEPTIRGSACLTPEKREEVRNILDRRSRTPAKSRVVACVRSKDFGRFLPEWVAYHYAIGVDEMIIYDNDSIDDTRGILEPFVKSGIVQYNRWKLGTRARQMRPLNECLAHYQAERSANSSSAPKWILFHDTDEYLYPINTSLTVSEALERHNATCCVLVKRVQYGSSGYRETPQGLTLEMFLTHASEKSAKDNRLPKVFINLDPSTPELGVVQPPLPSMHGVKKGSCKCDVVPLKELRINHYLGSIGDYVDKTRRYWKAKYSADKVELFMSERDVNTHTSDVITHWACATREVLARVEEGLPLSSEAPLVS